MNDDSRDLTKVITQDLESKWIALSEDYARVVDSSEDLMVLKDRVGTDNVIYMKVPKSGVSYAFCTR